MSTEKPQYCEILMQEIQYFYKNNINGSVDILICVIGVILNLLNILVFTRENVISPVNLIFTHLAFADLTALLATIPFSWVMSNQPKEWTYNTYIEAAVYLWGSSLSTMLHFASILLTVQLAIWRYIAIAYPLKERQWCNMRTTHRVMIIGYIISILLGMMMYFSRSIEQTTQVPNYKVNRPKNSILYHITLLVIGMVGALLPSIVLTMFSLKLIVILASRNTHKEQSLSPSTIENNIRNRKTKQIDRSVKVLLTVLVLFLTAEFPKGILYLVSTIQENGCYGKLMKIFYFITNINTSITFVGYYITSQQFRLIFKSLFNHNTSTIPEQLKPTDAPRSTRRCELGSENDEF